MFRPIALRNKDSAKAGELFIEVNYLAHMSRKYYVQPIHSKGQRINVNVMLCIIVTWSLNKFPRSPRYAMSFPLC